MFNYDKLASPYLREPMKEYVEKGLLDDRFIELLLSNNLVGTVQAADFININQIPQLCDFLTWEIPSTCWGSPEKVRNWIARGGLEGSRKKQGKKQEGSATP
jgi:hypothetical protein